MNCPDCGKYLTVHYAPERVAIGVECVSCKRAWTSERIERIGDDLREHLYRHTQGIVNSLDFPGDCVEVKS